MKKNYAQELFTEIVNGYLSEGKMINVQTMSGHQGELCKVDIRVDRNTIDRVWMTNESLPWGFGEQTEHETELSEIRREYGVDRFVVVKVERYVSDRFDSMGTFDTLWGGRGEIILREEFIEVGKNFILPREDALPMCKVAMERRNNRGRNWDCWKNIDSEKAKEICAKHARKIRGTMKATASDISNIQVARPQHKGEKISFRYSCTRNGKTYNRSINA